MVGYPFLEHLEVGKGIDPIQPASQELVQRWMIVHKLLVILYTSLLIAPIDFPLVHALECLECPVANTPVDHQTRIGTHGVQHTLQHLRGISSRVDMEIEDN